MKTNMSEKLAGTIRLGTRGSLLALHQTHMVKKVLEQEYKAWGLQCQPVVIKTRGDRVTQAVPPGSEIIGFFTKELEDALLRNEIDIAVHSLKDLPTELSAGLKLGAFLTREDYRDVLISSHELTLREMADWKKKGLLMTYSIGTSSIRRKAQLLHYCREFQIKEMRGNIDTRLRKLESGYCDALVLASAGIKRIGMKHRITEYIEPEICMPAACQGIIGLEIRSDNTAVEELLAAINHPETALCAGAERSFLRAIQGGCQLPLGCFSRVEQKQLHIAGVLAHPDGDYVIKADFSGHEEAGEELAYQLAERLLSQGGTELLKKIRERV